MAPEDSTVNSTVNGQGASSTTTSTDNSLERPLSNPTPTTADSTSRTTTIESPSEASSSATAPPVATTTVAAASSPESQLNGDSKTSEADSEMSKHHLPPGTSPHGSSSYPTTLSPSRIYHPPSGISTTQYSSYPPSTQPSDGYRASPVVNSPLSLPSMRTMDSMAQQASRGLNHNHSHSHGHNLGINTSIPSISTGASYYSPPSTLPSHYGISSDTMARYAAMPHSPHSLLHRAPKKEIKRRTKTGCLTCRKRRIKCDEGHPTCNNCKKSKRECLGYDPIFRQQTIHITNTYGQQTSDHHHQPSTSPSVPSSEPLRTLPPHTSHSPASVIPNSAPLPAPPSAHLPAPLDARPQSYGSQPSVTAPNTHTPTPVSNGPLPSPSPAATSIPYPYAAIKTEASGPIPCIKIEPTYSSSAITNNGVDTRALPSSTHLPDPCRPHTGHLLYGSSQLHLRAKKMKINEILDLLGPPPAPAQVHYGEDMMSEIIKVYHEMYAGGLSAFFETNWYYFADNGKMSFPRSPELINNMGQFLRVLESVKANDHAQMAYSGALETRIVWQFAETAKWATSIVKTMSTVRVALPEDGDPIEAKNRLQVVEALLCGDYLDSNPLCPPFQHHDTVRVRQFDFWYHLAEFVRKRDNPNAQPSVKARDEVLNRMRHLLDGRENRDVLYSIAVVRELAPHFDPNYAHSVPQHLDETDPKNRLAVASKFILDESQVTGGTTNVVRRFSDIAARAFVNPGVNIARNS